MNTQPDSNPFASPEPVSTESAKPKAGNPHEAKPSTNRALGVLCFFAAIGFALLAALNLFISILGFGARSGSGAVAAGELVGGLFGVFIVSSVKFGIAFLLFRKSQELLNPQVHSATAKLKLIVNENVGLNTDGLSEPDFYINASDLELFSIYNQPSTQNDPQRLAQIVFEARQRLTPL